MLTMNPERSLVWIGDLPIRSTNALALATVSPLVSSATTTSTSPMTGTGEKKCSPSIRSGAGTAWASSAIGIEEVLEAMIAPSGTAEAIDGVVADGAIVASNTSSIPIAELAQAIRQPERVLGLHFFSPVPVMMLVEVVVALDTSSETVARARRFIERLGKRPIETKDRSGFIVNMLLVPYLMAAVRMYEEGFASREDIDNGMKLGCGHPMGPLTLCDFIGLDVLYAVCDSLYEEFKRDEYAPPPLMKRMVASGRLGRKSGRGFYDY